MVGKKKLGRFHEQIGLCWPGKNVSNVFCSQNIEAFSLSRRNVGGFWFTTDQLGAGGTFLWKNAESYFSLEPLGSSSSREVKRMKVKWAKIARKVASSIWMQKYTHCSCGITEAIKWVFHNLRLTHKPNGTYHFKILPSCTTYVNKCCIIMFYLQISGYNMTKRAILITFAMMITLL